MRLYRALLHLFPASFRAEYGAEMAAIHAQRRHDAAGAAGVVALWVETVLDLVVSAARAHFDILRQDLAYSRRTLRRSPGFAATAITVAALGVGATTAAFSITDHILFRPLPFAEPDRLVRLWQNDRAQGYGRTELSPANYRDWKRMSRSFSGMGALFAWSLNLGGDGQPERVNHAGVTHDVLPLLGVAPVLGRVFGPDDDRPGAPGTVVLSYGLWQARFAGEPSVLGRKVLLDGAPYLVIGVMPAAFHFPDRDTELWTAKRLEESDFADRGDCYLQVVARLAPGVSVEQARTEMDVVTAQLERAYPDKNAQTGATVHRLRDELPRQARMLPLALLGAAACLLLIACTNLTSLLLTRAMTRRKELGVRAALGAGRDRLVRQLLTESVLLAFAGGVWGVALAAAAVPVLARLVPNALPLAQAPVVDLRVLAFALVLTVATGVGFGVLPAVRAGGDAGVSGLQEGSRAGIGGRREKVRSALVVAEVTASVVLLVSCGLLLRALWRVQQVDPGFRPEGVLTLRTALPLPRYDATRARVRFYDRVLSEVRALPTVASAAYVTSLPMVMRGGIWSVVLPGQSQDPTRPRAALRFVSPGFFSTLGIPLVAGRDIRDSDAIAAPFVAVVSESLARRLWPGQEALGRRIVTGLAERTVVGVAGDTRVRGLEQASEPQVYLSYQQVPDKSIIGYTPKDLAVRTTGDPRQVLPSVRDIVRRADPEQPISDVRLLSDIVGAETAPRRIQVRVLGGFAGIAFLLAAVGIHGLLSFGVSSRAQEIGVRIALGARSSDILRMVLREGVLLAGAGIVVGLTLAYAAARSLEALLAGVRPSDAGTFAAAMALAMVMTVAGSVLPAWRAVRVDPLQVMRAE